MKISILSIGNELLKGTTINSNMCVIGQELFKLGVTPCFQATVNDSREEINKILNYIVPFSDVIIITGGLGPTADDLTIKTVADYFDLKLYQNQDVIDNISKRIRHSSIIDNSKKVEISTQNLKQAFVPENSEVLINANGTAPGIFIKSNEKRIFLLPGPPTEMKPMLIKSVIPEISRLVKDKLHFEIITTIGVSESELQGLVNRVIGTVPGIDIAYRASCGACELTFYGYDQKLVLKQSQKIRDKLGSSILSKGFTNIVNEIAFHLAKRNFTIATAESCTGGMIAAKITDLARVSSLFKGSCVVYSNEAKQKLLGVKQETIDKFGAVSKECVEEMVNGVCQRMNVDTGIAVTGIAGPNGGTDKKPVGLVYIATKFQGKVNIKKYIFNGDRNGIRTSTVFRSLDMLRQLLLG